MIGLSLFAYVAAPDTQHLQRQRTHDAEMDDIRYEAAKRELEQNLQVRRPDGRPPVEVMAHEINKAIDRGFVPPKGDDVWLTEEWDAYRRSSFYRPPSANHR